MKANELRIGNFVKLCGLGSDMEVCVTSVSQIQIHYAPRLKLEEETDFLRALFCYVEPIPLTEEWLLWLGFTVKVKNYSLNIGSELFEYAIKDQFVIWNAKDSLELRIKKQGPGWVFREMTEKNDLVYKYVHQLQNLYFALTGEELILNK